MPRDRAPLKHSRRKAEGRPSAPSNVNTRDNSSGERLQKVMAAAGVGSRRHCETLITSGRVEVDGRTATELGTKVLPGQDVRVDGVSLVRMRHAYYLVNKPTGVVSTNFDPSGRPRVIDLLPPVAERLFTIGRLDMSSEGLILVTNDGDLANHLAHPRYGVEKTYQVQVAGLPDAEVLASLRRGVHLAEGMARVDSVRVKKALKQSTLLEIVLTEGKNREIRRVLAKVGHKVLRLRRIAIGPLRLGEMAPGEFRKLSTEEVRELRGARPGAAPRRGKRPRPLRKSRPAGQTTEAASTGKPRVEGQGEARRPAGKHRSDKNRQMKARQGKARQEGAPAGQTRMGKPGRAGKSKHSTSATTAGRPPRTVRRDDTPARKYPAIGQDVGTIVRRRRSTEELPE